MSLVRREGPDLPERPAALVVCLVPELGQPRTQGAVVVMGTLRVAAEALRLAPLA